MLIASLIYFFYLFTWLGWSAWMPFYLANEKHLGFQTMSTYLSIWMFVAIFAYWFCGWLCDQFGRRWVIPAFAVPGSIALIAMGYLDDATSLFWVGLATNFLITGSFGTGLAIPPRCSRRRSAAPRWVPHSPSAWASPRSHR
jgi:MFS family permease